jgi:DNA-binding CsgD family transcriptional regulator
MMNTVTYSNSKAPVNHSASRVSNQLFQLLVENPFDGAMILTKTGELVVSNIHASEICHQLTQKFAHQITHQLTQNLSRVPQQVWRCCQALIENQSKFIEDEIKIDQVVIRIRAWWLAADLADPPHLYVTLEDQHQTVEYRARAEARRYGLTERETQVWLLKRSGYSYKAIAAELHIAEDTVKKHMKSIYNKRDTSEWLND